MQNPNGGGISINGALSVGTNNLTLKSGGTVTQSKAITANGLELLGSGTFTLTNTANNINILAGNTTNDISYTDSNSFTVGTVNSIRGIRTPGNVTLTAGTTIDVIAGANTSPFEAIGPSNIVTLNAGEDIILGTQPFTNQYGDITASQIILNADRDITVQNTTWLTATGTNGFKAVAGRNFNLVNPALVTPSRVRSTAVNAPLTITTGASGILNLNSNTTGAVQANGGIITLNTNQLDLLSGSVQSTNGQLLIQPVTASTTIGIGTGAVGTLNLDNAEIGRFADGFSLITIGSATGSGAIEVKGSPTFTDNLVLRNPTSGGIQILSALNLGTNNLTLNSGGIINQIGAGGITAGGLELLGSGSVSLENPANNITTLAGNTTNNISFRDTNGFVIGTVNTIGLTTSTGNITLNAGGAVTQSKAIIANGLELLGSGTFTLTNAANNINILAGNTTNNISYTDTDGFDISTVNSTSGVNVGTNNLTLKAGNTVTQSKAITANGLELLGSGTFTLTNTANNINILAGNTTDKISYTDANTFQVGTVNTIGLTSGLDIILNSISGDVTLDSNTPIASTAGTITLQAGRNIIGNSGSSITTQGNNVILNSDRDSTNGGAIQLTETTITSNGGNITLGGGKDGLSMAIGTIGFNNGIWLDNSRLEADSGDILLMGQGRNAVAANSQGIRLINNSIIKTTSGTIELVGNGGNRLLGIIDNNSGINITDSEIQSDSGLISLTGIGGSSPVGANNSGVIVTNSSIVNLDGNISITGTAGNALLGTLNNNTGITVSGSEINNQRGEINLSGFGGNSLLGASNIGISIINKSAIKNTDGDINLSGTGGNSLTNLITNNDGVNISQSELINSTGTIEIIGIGGKSLIGKNNVGLRLVDNSNLSNNTGDIDLTGTGGLSLKGNTGILQDNTAVKAISGNIFYNAEGTGSAIGLIVKDTSTIGAGTSGDITLISEAMELGGEIHGHHVLLRQPISADPLSDFVVQTGGFIQANKLNLDGVSFILDQSKNDIQFLVGNVGLRIQYTDNNGFEIMGLESPTAILTAGGLITQSAPITVKNLAILGTGDTELTNPNNAIEKIAADTTGNLTVVNRGTLTVDKVNPDGIENANNVLLQSLAGDLVLNEAINAIGDITLIADSNFINNVGTGALITTTGRFLVYATSPDTNVNGWSVLGGSQQFNTTYPQVALFTGNGFLYKVGAPFVPGLPNLLTTEPVTFTFNFNDRQWRDLQIGSEDLVITEPLLCINGEQNTTSSSQQEVRDFELPLLANNAPYGSQPTRNFVTLQWQLGEFPTCPSSD